MCNTCVGYLKCITGGMCNPPKITTHLLNVFYTCNAHVQALSLILLYHMHPSSKIQE